MDNLGWFSQGTDGQKQVKDANQFGMFASVRSTAPSAMRSTEIQQTSQATTTMTPQAVALFKKSLKSNRWDHLDLGQNKSDYTHDNMVSRWVVEKNKWLQRQPQIGSANGEQDVRGNIASGNIPQSETDATRLAIRRLMKQLSGPYSAFDKYYPLEDTIELYNEIWYESSSSDE